jgi:glycine/D-amino acid oxidase-like deaminating enzyme
LTPSTIVVGAGVFGASIASELSARQWDVTLVERHAPANSRSSSGDFSRLLRFAHAGDPATDEWYTRSAWRARSLWHELAEEDDRELLTERGAVWFITGDGDAVTDAERLMRKVGPAVERLVPAAVKSLFVDVAVDDLAYGLYEVDAAVLRANLCVQALVRQALRRGARFVHGTAAAIVGGVEVAGERYTADVVIWACGAWLGKLFPRWAPIIATRQMVFYWDVDPAWSSGPAWIDPQAEVYGMPDLDGLGLKAQSDLQGATVDPDAPRDFDTCAQHTTAAYLGRRFPALAGTPLLRGHAMHYELTPDANFRVGPIPESPDTWLVGGGSGHGFKHGPALGEYVADVLEARRPLEDALAVREVKNP